MGSRADGLQSLQRTVLVESSQARDQTCVPDIGRQIPNHCITEKVPGMLQSELSELSACVPLNRETVGPTFTHPGPFQFNRNQGKKYHVFSVVFHACFSLW